MSINRVHKDRLFKFIFGNPEYLEWTLSLYNAVNGTNYTNAADITLTTVENVIYMGMKNDVSFLIGDTMNFYEQQIPPQRYADTVGGFCHLWQKW